MTSAEFMITLLRCFFKNEINDNISDFDRMKDIFDLSRTHKIENITLAAVEKAGIPIDGEMLSRWRRVCEANTAQMVFQELEKERLAEAFNEAKIDFLPLKGWYLRDTYPKKEYRFMSDLDILVHRSDREAASVLMKQLGYSGGMGNFGKDDSYNLPPFIHVEIHLDLFSIEQETWHNYYQSVWDKAILVSGCEYKLNLNDSFVHIMMNYLKDYTLKGTGIRSVIDFYFFLKKYRSELDFDYINEQFKTLGVYELAGETLQLVEDWFGDDPKILGSEMGDRLLGSGIYGTSKELVQHRYDELSAGVKGKTLKKIVYLMKRAFPNMKIMKYKYPVLNKAPFLLPVCWCMRLVRNSDRAEMEIKNIKKVKNR